MSAPPSRPFFNAPADNHHQPAYAALAVWTRELLFFEMWAGQMLCEAFNWVLKHIIKEDRPNGESVPVYGSLLDYAYLGLLLGPQRSELTNIPQRAWVLDMGSPHRIANGWDTSQRSYSATSPSGTALHRRDFVCLTGRARWCSTRASSPGRGLWHILGASITLVVLPPVLLRSARSYHLTYHSARQVLWGVAIGVVFGVVFYTLAEFIPVRHPKSLLGRLRNAVLSNPLSVWFRLRDGWLVYPDGGIEEQWAAWRSRWEVQHQALAEAKKSD